MPSQSTLNSSVSVSFLCGRSAAMPTGVIVGIVPTIAVQTVLPESLPCSRSVSSCATS